MKKLLFTLFAFALAAGPALLPVKKAYAETKPIAAVAIKSYDELLSNINYVGELSERPDLGNAFEGLLALGTQGMGLNGIDKARPWGFVVQANGDEITGYAFLPITDGNSLVKLLGLYTTVKSQGGMQKFTQKNGKQVFYGKEKGKWMMFSDKPAALKTVAADPSALLAGADKQHLVTGRIFLANVPEKFRQMAINKIEEGAKKELDKKSDEPEDLHTARTKASDEIVDAMKIFIKNMDQITLGWGLDRSAEKLFAEMNFTALADTPLAEQMDSLEKSTSKFAALELTGQAASAHIAAPISEMKAGVLNSVIALARKQALADAEKKTPEDSQALAKGLINNVADLLEKIVKSGRFDVAASVSLEPEAALGLLAANVADGELLDKTLHTIADTVKDLLPPAGDMIKLDADKVNDVKLHTVTFPFGPETKDREKMVRMFGEEMHIVIGVGAESAYIAAGRDALEKLKKAISANAPAGEKSVSPAEVSISGEKVAAFSAVNGEEKDLEKMKMAAEELKTMPGKDHITFVAKSVPRGVQYRLEIEKGLLKTAVKLGSEGKN